MFLITRKNCNLTKVTFNTFKRLSAQEALFWRKLGDFRKRATLSYDKREIDLCVALCCQRAHLELATKELKDVLADASMLPHK